MSTLILRTIAPFLSALMLLFSLWVLLRGHNNPGGGFIGGLIAASAIAIYGIAHGVAPARRALFIHPNVIAGAGLLLSALSGFVPALLGDNFLTGEWWEPVVFGTQIHISNIVAFDVGVYLVVLGSLTSIALHLEDPGAH